MLKTIKKSLLCILLLAPVTHAQSAMENWQLETQKNADGGYTLMLVAGDNVQQSITPYNEDPAIRKLLVNFFGYTKGNYTHAQAGGPIIAQVLDSLQSQKEEEMINQPLPDGRRLLASLNNMSSRGEERAALLIDQDGTLQAVALVHGKCLPRNDHPEELVCDPKQKTLLSIFTPAPIDPQQVKPLLEWSEQIPKRVTLFYTENEIPRVSDVEYVITTPDQPAWEKSELPAVLPDQYTSLLWDKTSINIIYIDGKDLYHNKDVVPASKRTADIQPIFHNIMIDLKSYDTFDACVLAYKQLLPHAKLRLDERNEEAVFSGTIEQASYTVEISGGTDFSYISINIH